jgi:hypothetical protein
MTSDAAGKVGAMNILAMTKHMGIRYEEFGLVVAGAGGVLIAFGNAMPLGRRAGGMLGGLAIAAGMVIAVIGVHSGKLG